MWLLRRLAAVKPNPQGRKQIARSLTIGSQTPMASRLSIAVIGTSTSNLPERCLSQAIERATNHALHSGFAVDTQDANEALGHLASLHHHQLGTTGSKNLVVQQSGSPNLPAYCQSLERDGDNFQ